jgi:hypothetical protein
MIYRFGCTENYCNIINSSLRLRGSYLRSLRLNSLDLSRQENQKFLTATVARKCCKGRGAIKLDAAGTAIDLDFRIQQE